MKWMMINECDSSYVDNIGRSWEESQRFAASNCVQNKVSGCHVDNVMNNTFFFFSNGPACVNTQ